MNQCNHNVIMKSTLYIVATPIGNINDISQRALFILREVDLIAAEDTRNTGLLLQHLKINKKLISLHEHNEKNQVNILLSKLKYGQNIALVSDAGTPLISDPGYHVIRQCRSIGIRIIPIPGPCAAITALSASGLPTNRFCYEGFLPIKEKSRKDYLQTLTQETRTLIFYESKYRLLESLQDMSNIWGPLRYIVLARELTKKWEIIIGGSIEEFITWIKDNTITIRGEIVLIVEGFHNEIMKIPSPEVLHAFSLLRLELPFKQAISLTAKIFNIRKNMLYRYVIKHDIKLNI